MNNTVFSDLIVQIATEISGFLRCSQTQLLSYYCKQLYLNLVTVFVFCFFVFYFVRRVWRYQRGNQNPYIEEEQTTQWPNEKVQKAKQRSTKHTHKTKDRVTRTPLSNLSTSSVRNTFNINNGTNWIHLKFNHCK
jgi:hypothetical protein